MVDHCSPARRIAFDRARPELERLCGAPLRGTVLLFVGNLLGKHNAAAARWLVEVLAPRLPSDCSLVLAGPGTDAVASPHSARAHVCRLGGVPDIDVVIGGADLCLAPLAAGAGVKTKVLHYLAHRKPVVATPVSLEGIEDAPGVEAAGLDEFPSVIVELVSRGEAPELRARRETLQATWLHERYGPDRVANQWRDALQLAGVNVA